MIVVCCEQTSVMRSGNYIRFADIFLGGGGEGKETEDAKGGEREDGGIYVARVFGGLTLEGSAAKITQISPADIHLGERLPHPITVSPTFPQIPNSK